LSASRFNRKARERLLYIAAGLVILVILSFTIWLIPFLIKETIPAAMPENLAPVFWVLLVIHLIILAALIWEIRLSRQGGRLRKTGLIIPGIIMILMSMFLIDAAGANLQNLPEMFNMAMILFISAFCDLITGIITIMLPTRLPYD